MASQNAEFIVVKGGKKVLRAVNIRIGGLRTSARLSPVIARAVEKIAAREGCGLDKLCGYIDRKKEKGVSRSTAIRDFAFRYFIEAATEAGHRRAGHGNLIRKSARRRAPGKRE
jgi:predicted DNA-binding ribbon-helix-helix protein